MLKYTLISLLLWTYFTWVYSSPTEITTAEVGEDEEELAVEFNATIPNDFNKPQPRFAQLNINHKVYNIYFSKLNWFTALEYCNFHGQALASIQNVDDNIQLIRVLKQYGLQQTEPFWLGANDLGHFGHYVWTNNGQPITYFTNWRIGEPNNVSGNEHCIELLSDGQWNDMRCDAQRRFICENRTPSNSYDIPIYG